MALQSTQFQLPYVECSISHASELLATGVGVEARGAIFTRLEVVDFILDLAGYTVDQPLHERRLLEPSFGAGDFLLPVILRLLTAWRTRKSGGAALEDLGDAIRAVELHRASYTQTRANVISLLETQKVPPDIAVALADRWLVQGDFLRISVGGDFDFVVGNPPYVRQELIPPALLAEYRRLYQTLYDRADLYIPFIERSLSLLSQGGCLAYICADRWMKNRYGGPLRSFVADNFHLKVYVDMTDTPAFHTDVVAYPAVTIISREKPGPTRIAHRPAIDHLVLKSLSESLRNPLIPANCKNVRELARVTNGSEPWLLESADQMALIRSIESRFPLLEEAACKVGIGVATGADKVFIGDFDSLDVELDRKLPIATTRDINSGTVSWQGRWVINPYENNGGLVNLDFYPKLKAYLESHKDIITKRHCAKTNPEKWYKTIDRITPSLARTPKLLIPDIKGEANIVFENGKLYPHHNLYYIISDDWNLKALQAVMLSSITKLFIATYSTKMRGGFLRFQAQYLRRVRIPHWVDVPEALRTELIDAAEKLDIEACNQATAKLYKLTPDEISAIGGISK